jgi:hypothetical protein
LHNSDPSVSKAERLTSALVISWGTLLAGQARPPPNQQNERNTMTRLQRIRLTRQEAYTAQILGTPVVLFFIVTTKILWKMKRWLAIFLLTSFVIYGVSIISVNADSPKANLTHPTAVSPTPTSEQQQIDDDIKLVFGKYYPQAMLLLKGDGTPHACHENGGLDPNAVNDNTTWGGVGQDIGVFQINTYWQKVTNTAFLKDPKINVRIAWRIFVNNGYRFGVMPLGGWTCGRYYHI